MGCVRFLRVLSSLAPPDFTDVTLVSEDSWTDSCFIQSGSCVMTVPCDGLYLWFVIHSITRNPSLH